MRKKDKIIDVIIEGSDAQNADEVISEIKKGQENKDLFNQHKITLALLSSTKKMTEYKIEQSYRSLIEKIHPKQKLTTLSLRPLMRYAAIFIFAFFVFSITFLLTRNFYKQSDQSELYTTIETAYGETSKIVLPDGSVVKLNSGTTLMFNNNFSVNNRNIFLQGEAFFEVTRNEEIPLIVNFSKLKVKVLGTAFNVEAYTESQKVNIALEKGSIEISHEQNLFNPIIIHPGEYAQYDKECQEINLKTDGFNCFIAWKNGVLTFKEESMEEVIKKLERRFNVNIEVNSPAIYDLVFTATIKDENLKEVLDMMKFASNVDYAVHYSNDFGKRTNVILNN